MGITEPNEKVDRRVSVNVTAAEQERIERAARSQFRTVATLGRVAILEYLDRLDAEAAA